MVNELHTLNARGVKAQPRRSDDPQVTSKGGMAAVQAFAKHIGLWKWLERLLPKRKDPTQGYSVAAVVCAQIAGLISGGEGFSATEPLRGDAPLLRLLGLDAAPSAETVEEVMKYLKKVSGVECLNRVQRRLAVKVLGCLGRRQLLELGAGFVPVWGDGSVLEVTGKKFDSIKVIKGKAGQMCAGMFVGPMLTGMDFAEAGEGELSVVRPFLTQVFRGVLGPLKLVSDALVLLDSLYGDGPTFDLLESLRGSPAFIVGVQKLETAQKVMAELPESSWREMGPDPARGLTSSAYARAWIQCEDWKKKRPMICHRFTLAGEMVTNYAGVVTNLHHNDTRIIKLMKKWRLPLEETIWKLYGRKQALENQWKELLSDLGLHHPPCAQAAVNAVFYGVAGLAYNLTVGVRRLGFTDPRDRDMRLWRFRREVIDLAARTALHAGQVWVRLLDARDHLVDRLLSAMHRLARC